MCSAVVASLDAQQPWTRFDASRTLELLRADGDDTSVWMYSYVLMNDQIPILRVGLSTNKNDQLNRHGRREHAGDLQLMQYSAEQLGLALSGRGRKMFPTTNMFLARRWLDECITSHNILCSQPGLQEDQPRPNIRPTRLRVIDVNDRCLVTLPHSTDYVALSYCWPREPGLTNTSTNQVDLNSKGAVSKSNGLSLALDDACDAVLDLNERYLWIDALCIVQDDAKDKVHQISQMDLVYGDALLTIVIAPVNDKLQSPGLPVYRSTTSARLQSVIKLPSQDIEVAVPKPCLEDILSYTRYETRGWTFQESHISRRCLFFTDHQLYFQCSCGMRCEDTANENHKPDTYVKHSTNIWNPKNAHATDENDNYGELSISRTMYEDDNEALTTYGNFVSAYLRRELSFRSDILNAFHGISKLLCVAMDTEFYAGLPLKWLDHALLWQLYGSTDRQVGFPAFSWAGWVGGAEAPYWLRAESTRQLVTWYRLEEGLWTKCHGKEELKEPLIIIPELDSSAYLDVTSTIQWSLATITQVASFMLSTSATGLEDAAMWPDSEHVWILDDSSRRAGLILIDRAWMTQSVTKGAKHDFILLSSAQRSRIRDVPNFDDTCFEQRDWCLVNVMLVRWQNEGVAERIAVGTMHCDAWFGAESTTKVVQLC
ncbi:hypothetical protein HBI74_077970 [Parastagonospora nodorum]|nr:hypothetical protein HBI74_077970 [Parastagonospora nodorum]